MADWRGRARARPSIPAASDPSPPVVLSFGGPAAAAVSATAVRRAFGAWEAERDPETVQPPVPWTTGLLVLLALVESGRSVPLLAGAPRVVPWEQDVVIPREPVDLQRRTGLSNDTVRRALDRLISCELVDCVGRIGDEMTVRVRSTVFEEAPVLAAVAWENVRQRLEGGTDPVTLLVLYEIAHRTTVADRAAQRAIRITLREFERAVGINKTTVRVHLERLKAARLIASESRDRFQSWHRLLPAAFGAAPATATEALSVEDVPGIWSDPSRRPAVASPSDHGDVAQGAAVRPSSPNTPSRGASPGASADTVPTIHIGANTFHVASGVSVRVELDAEGRTWYVIGPAMRIGPF